MKVWLSSHAVTKMNDEAAALHPLESGGVLLGWRSGEDRVVLDVTGPGPYALHGRHRFLPDHRWQVAEIHRAFYESDGDLDYLGDWHSHPGGIAAMSEEDKSTLRRITKRVQDPLMLIVAGSPDYRGWSSACWKGQLRRIMLYRRFEAHPQELAVFDPPAAWGSTLGNVTAP